MLLFLFAAFVFAQRDLGTIAGTVTDPQGAVVPNARVTITEAATGLKYELTTNTAGEFVRPALKPGTYSVEAEATGFRRVQQQNVQIVGGDRVAVPLTLAVGDVNQSIEVSAQAPVLQTESTKIGANLDSKAISDIPLGGQRNISYLARLSPGVVPAEQGARDSANGGFSANGVRSNGQNNYLLNGVDNNINTIDFLNQTSYAIAPSPDSVAEINIITNGYNAEYGRAAGGVMNVTLKSGTNALHGDVFEYLQNKDLDANRWENNLAGKPRGPFEQNQFGATAGGPIIKNKLFMFGDYQGTRISDQGGSYPNLGYSGFTTIPTAAMKTGDFSGELGRNLGTDPTSGMSIVQGSIFDPSSTVYNGSGLPVSRTMFPGNIIPQSRFDPAFAKVIQLYPSPNQPVVTGAGTSPTNDYFYATPGKWVTDQGDARVDYHLSDKNSLFGSLSWSNTSKADGAPLPGALDDTGFNGAQEIDLSRNAQVSFTRVWSSSLITESRVGFTRLVTSRLGSNPTTDEFKAFGIGGYDPTGSTANNGGLPQIGFSNGYPTVGATDWVPTKEYNNVWDFIQNVSLIKGKHSYKFGAEFRPIQFPFFQVPDPHGNIGYSNNETAFPSTQHSPVTNASFSGVTGDAMASALLGSIDSGNISTTNFVSSRKIAWAFYAQDDWKVTSKLTLNLGVRYDLWSPIYEQWGRQSNFDLQNETLYIPKGPNQNAALPPNFATLFPNVTVSRGQVPSTLIPWDKMDFGPRIGLAYQLNDKTVIRIGYGIFYGGEENQGGSPNRGEGVPFNETVNLSRTQGLSSFIGVSDPACTGCNFFPGGLTGGYPLSPFTLPAGISMRGVQSDFTNSLVHKWNVAVQRELPGSMSVEVSYDGNHQAHQVILWNSDPYPNFGTFNTSISSASLQEIQPACPPPTCQSVGNGLSTTSSFGFGNYDALSVKVEKRYSSGLQFVSAYTWSHTLANSGTPLSGSSNFGPLTQTDWATGYATAAWDIRHNFTSGFNYDLPIGKGKRFGGDMNRFADSIIGGWTWNGLLSLRTGQPFTIAGASCNGVWSRCLPDIVPGTTPNAAPAGGRAPSQWFNTANFAVAAPLTGGDLGLQSNNGPPTRTLDTSIFKTFSLTERFKMQFRAESFNIANTPQYGLPDASFGDSKQAGGNGKFGTITSTQASSERHVQFSLKLLF
jgi:hypothetical protein